MRDLIISDVSGGQRNEDRILMSANEAARLVGFDHRRGGLRVDHGSDPIALTTIPACEAPESYHRFVNLGEYTTANGDQILLGKRGQHIWFGVKDSWYRPARNYISGREPFSCSMTGLELRDRGYRGATITEHGTTRLHDWRGDVRLIDGAGWIETDFIPASYDPGPPARGAFSIAAWVKMAPGGRDRAAQVICGTWRGGYSQGFRLELYYGRPLLKLYATVGYATVQHYADQLTEDEWHLIHVSYNYVDGVLTANIWIDGVASPDVRTTGGCFMENPYSLQIGGQTDIGGNLQYSLTGQLGWLSLDLSECNGDIAAADYARESPRYVEGPAALPVTWRPLLADVKHGSAWYVRGRGKSTASESFFQIGADAFFGSDDPTLNDYLMRWHSGFWLAEGKVYCSGPATVLFYPASTPNVNVTDRGRQVAAGDIIFFRTWSTDYGAWFWDMTGRVIKSVNQTTNVIALRDGFDTRGKGDPNSPEGDDYCEYVIVRVHKQAVPIGGTTQAIIGGMQIWTLPTGMYHYMYCYGSSATGDKGKCAASAAIILTQGVSYIPRISGWVAEPSPYHIDRIYIYRAFEGGPFKLVHTLTRNYWQWPDFAMLWEDNSEPAGEDAEADAYYRDPPPVLRSPVFLNDRIWGWDQADPQVLWLSSLGQYAAFAPVDLNTDLGSTLTDVGGYIQIGQSSADKGVAILPDIGAYATTGVIGDSILLFLPRSTLRLYGIDRTDFQIQQAFEIGAASRRLAQNFAGRIVFVAVDGHVYLVPAGGHYPDVISQGLWPTGIPAPKALLDRWSLAVWDDQYVFCGPTAEDTNERVYLCSRANHTWRSLALGLTDVLALKDTSVYDLLGSGFAIQQVSNHVFNAPIYALGGMATSQEAEYISGGLDLERAGDEMRRYKHFGYVTMCWRGAATQINGTVSLYEAGNLSTPIATAPFTVPAGAGVRTIVRVHLKGNAVIPQLGIALPEAVYPAALDWVRIEGDVHP